MIDLGIRTHWLYSALRLEVTFVEKATAAPRVTTGSGFVIGADDGRLAVATCRHVVDPTWSDTPGMILERIDLRGTSIEGSRGQPKTYSISFTDPSPVVPEAGQDDLALLTLDDAVAEWTDQSSTEPVRISPVVNQEMIAAEEDFDGHTVSAGDFLVTPSYVPFDGIDGPVLISGVLASDPRYPVETTYLRQRSAAIRTTSILYQTLSFGGMSGSPVFAVQRGLQMGGGLKGPPHRRALLVGVNSGHLLGGSGSPGHSYFARSTGLLRLLHAARQ